MDPTLTAAAIGVGGTVIVGLAGFWANVRNTSKTTALTLRAVELAEQGQVTDRYSKAIEQLGSDKLDVRIGGVYALERVARDSVTDHPTVMDVLAAFIREHSREHGAQAVTDVPWYSPLASGTRPDVQAALTVIGRRDTDRDRQPIDLSRAHIPAATLHGADLTAANLDRADLSGASLTGARLPGATLPATNLTDANLSNANLGGAFLLGATLTGAYLHSADLKGAWLQGADLSGAKFINADLTGAGLGGANLTGADLRRATLTGADLTGADLTGADLTGADLTGAILDRADLSGSDLTGATLSQEAPVPDDWVRDPGSGRLSPDHGSGGGSDS